MRHTVHNRATIRVADRTDVSGRVTAGSINGCTPLSSTLKLSTTSIKRKPMPSASNLFYHWGGKRLSQLLALFVALAVSTPVLLADDGDHDRSVDPIVGSWIVHVTIDTIEIAIPPPNPPPVLPIKFDNVAALTADGITADFGPPSTIFGPWEKVGPRTYRQKIVTVDADGSIITAFTGPLVLNQQGDQISGPMRTIVTNTNGQVTLEYSGTLLFNRITFTSTP